MAQKILGIDIGNYSVKTALFESTFKKLSLKKLKTFHFTNRAEAGINFSELKEIVERIAKDNELKATTYIVGIGDYLVFKKFLTFPFEDRKKVDSTIKFSLEDLVPVSASDLVIDYQLIEKKSGQNLFYSFSTKKEIISKLLEIFKGVNIDPKFIMPASLAYLNYPVSEDDEDDECRAFIDIGYKTVNFLFVKKGVPVFFHTLMKGTESICEKIAEKFDISPVEAEKIVLNGMDEKFDREELFLLYKDIGNEIFREIKGFIVKYNLKIKKIYVGGGGAVFRDFVPFLENLINFPVNFLNLDEVLKGEFSLPLKKEDVAIFGKAILLALNGISGKFLNEINFRRGEFEYQGGYKYLLDRMGTLLFLVFLLIFALGFKTYIHKSILEQDYAEMKKELAQISQTFLKKKITDFDSFIAHIKIKEGADLKKLIPEKDGFDVFFEISNAIESLNGKPLSAFVAGESGAGSAKNKKAKDENKKEDDGKISLLSSFEDTLHKDKLFVELYRVTFEKDTVNITAEANTMDTIEQFIEKLKQAPCFRHVILENSEVITFKRHKGWRRFKVVSKFDCSKKKAKKEENKKSKKSKTSKGTLK